MIIYPENKSQVISFAKDKNAFLRQGIDPKNAKEEGLVRSAEWRSFIDGEEVFTYSVPVTRGGTQSFVMAETEGEGAKVRTEYAGPLRSARLYSLKGEVPLTLLENAIEFTYEGEGSLLLEVNGSFREPLAIFLSRREEPDFLPEDEKVLWFAPGIHYLRNLELVDNQIVYLAPGAVLKAVPPEEADPFFVEKDWAGVKNYEDFLFAREKSGIKICGRGILDTTGLDWHMRRTVVFSDCENISVSGILLNGAAHWTMPFFGCKNVKVKNVKLLGYRENSDGINLVDCEQALVEDCFIRTGDDGVCVKSMGLNKHHGSGNITIRNCMVWNDKVRAFGIAGETRYDIRNVTFEDCLVVHSFADWTREVGALCIVISDSGTIHDITFRRICICQEHNYAVNMMIMKDFWSTDEDAGRIENILFEDIQIPDNSLLYFEGYDEAHSINNIYFRGIRSLDDGKEVEFEKYIHKNKYVALSLLPDNIQ